MNGFKWCRETAKNNSWDWWRCSKENSGGPKFVRTDKNIRLVEEMILSQEDQSGTHFTPSKIARELNTDLPSVSV